MEMMTSSPRLPDDCRGRSPGCSPEESGAAGSVSIGVTDLESRLSLVILYRSYRDHGDDRILGRLLLSFLGRAPGSDPDRGRNNWNLLGGWAPE